MPLIMNSHLNQPGRMRNERVISERKATPDLAPSSAAARHLLPEEKGQQIHNMARIGAATRGTTALS